MKCDDTLVGAPSQLGIPQVDIVNERHQKRASRTQFVGGITVVKILQLKHCLLVLPCRNEKVSASKQTFRNEGMLRLFTRQISVRHHELPPHVSTQGITYKRLFFKGLNTIERALTRVPAGQ